MTLELPTQDTDRDLVIIRVLDAPRDSVYRCWTEPDLLKQWFAPKPWGVSKVDSEVRAGGRSVITMVDEQGNEFPNPGQYLDVVPNERLIFSDAFTGDWAPSAKPFFTGIITFEDAGDGKTKYTAVARHWTAEDAANHKAMGFHQGWNTCADQLEELAARI